MTHPTPRLRLGNKLHDSFFRALFGGPSQRSASETQIIGSADGARSDPGIRSQIGSPDTQVVDKGLVVRDILAAPEGDGRDASAAIPTS